MTGYHIPAEVHRTELVVVNSRFITTAAPVFTVGDAKRFLSEIRNELKDASHHVYAYRVGHGNTVIDGMSDDGEPSGTSGPPTLAVLRGTNIGDVIVVNTRYFGGTKLGTGGLVRAYSEATRLCLNSLPLQLKIEKRLLGFDAPYTYYENVKLTIAAHNAIIMEEVFADVVTLYLEIPIINVDDFTTAIVELSSGVITPIDLTDLYN